MRTQDLRFELLAGSPREASVPAAPVTFTIAADRVGKGQLLMAGLAEEIRGLWGSLSGVVVFPADDGRLHLDPAGMVDVLNWVRRALTTIRTLDLEIFQSSNVAGYLAARAADPRGMAIRGLTGPRNNAVHHPEIIDAALERAWGPCPDGLYVIVPRWVERTPHLDPAFSSRGGQFSQSYARAYDDHVACRSLVDPLMDVFDFFDSLAPTLARRDDQGNLVGFPLPPPPYADETGPIRRSRGT